MRQRRETLPHRFYMLFLCDTFFSATRSVVACRASVLPQSRETQARAEVASIGEAAPSPARDLRFSVRLAPLSRIGRACCLKGKRRAVAASRARGRGSLKRRTTMERVFQSIFGPVFVIPRHEPKRSRAKELFLWRCVRRLPRYGLDRRAVRTCAQRAERAII